MRFLVYSEVNSETISQSLGLSEYSYYFVLKEFLPVLRELGDVCVVKEPREVDSLYAQALREGLKGPGGLLRQGLAFNHTGARNQE